MADGQPPEEEERFLGPPVFIKKIKPLEAPHGGAWKVAYADFVTAMMAFFLLLWLLMVATDEQKHGLSEYFEPQKASSEQIGTGGVLAGLALSAEGALRSAGSPPTVTVALPTFGGEAEEETEGESGKASEAARAAAEKETEQFAKAESTLRAAIENAQELQTMRDSLLIDQTPEGLRIQIIDQEGVAMFKSGSADLQDQARALLALVTGVVNTLPNRIAISGHTDSVKFGSSTYTNWELSGDRANASRRALVESGLSADRIEKVVGKADQDHLFADEPESHRNRRIAIVLLRENLPADAASNDAGSTE